MHAPEIVASQFVLEVASSLHRPGAYAVAVLPCPPAADRICVPAIHVAAQRALLVRPRAQRADELRAEVIDLVGSVLQAEQATLDALDADRTSDPVAVRIDPADGLRLTWSLVVADPGTADVGWEIEAALAGPLPRGRARRRARTQRSLAPGAGPVCCLPRQPTWRPR